MTASYCGLPSVIRPLLETSSQDRQERDQVTQVVVAQLLGRARLLDVLPHGPHRLVQRGIPAVVEIRPRARDGPEGRHLELAARPDVFHILLLVVRRLVARLAAGPYQEQLVSTLG